MRASLVLAAGLSLTPALAAPSVAAPPAAPPPGRSVYLNNVKIDGLTNQTFVNCTVFIDAHGDVYLTAKGYAVERVEKTPEGRVTSQTTSVPTSPTAKVVSSTTQSSASGAPPRPDHLTKRYYLVTMQSRVGATQLVIDVFVNGSLVRQVSARDEQTVEDLTGRLRPGPNRITLVPHRVLGPNGRISSSPSDWFQVVIGEGLLAGGKVSIDNVLVDWKRTAADETDDKAEYAVDGR